MEKTVAVGTWCTDDYSEYIGIKSLQNSLKYFHPEIDHRICDSKETDLLKKDYPWLINLWMK